jgi:HEAT repeat protein
VCGHSEEPDAQALAKQLRSAEVATRIAAAKGLSALPAPKLTPLIPQLAEALRDEYFDVRAGAMEALQKCGAEALLALVEALRRDDYYSQYGAARLLARLGPAAKPALDQLGRGLANASVDLRCALLQAIVEIGETIPVLPAVVTMLRDSNESVRSLAAKALGCAGKAAIPELVKLLDSPDPGVALSAVQALGEIGPDAGSTVPQLMARFLANIERVRKESEKESSPDMKTRHIRYALKDCPYIWALARLGAAVVAPLVELLKSGDETKRWYALEVLGKAGPAARSAVPELIKVLQGPGEAWNRARAAGTLGAIGPAAEAALPALVAALGAKGAEEMVSRYAVSALVKMGAKAVPLLTSALKDPDAQMRKQAATALGQLGPAAKAAVPALTEAARDGDPGVAQAAAEALKAIPK